MHAVANSCVNVPSFSVRMHILTLLRARDALFTHVRATHTVVFHSLMCAPAARFIYVRATHTVVFCSIPRITLQS